MSQPVLRYSRPNAELRGMISRLLTPEQLRALAAAPDLDAVLRSLMDTGYRSTASRLLERGASLVAAERAVDAGVVEAYRRTIRLLEGDSAALVVEMARRGELDNLKALLRAVSRGEPPEAVRPLLVQMGSLSQLPVEDLLRAEDVEAVANVLSAVDYGRVLRNALPRYVSEHSLFPVEIAVDLHYYRRLWAAVQRLSGRDLEVALQMMGIRYDVLNVDWILRYRLVYGLSPEEIINYTLPYGWRVDDAAIRRAATAEGIEGVVNALPEPYRSVLSGQGGARDPVERAGLTLQRYLVTAARSALAGYPFHLGVALAFLWLKEAEVHDLKAVLESKRYRLPPESVADRMWGTA